jgi:TonB family protein
VQTVCELLSLVAFLPSALCAQQVNRRPADFLNDARAQLAANRTDSAIVLLRVVTAPATKASRLEQAEAFFWLGIADFYKGRDSIANVDFRAALDHDPLMQPTDMLARLDSALAGMWEAQQTAAICGEPLPAWFAPGAPQGVPLNAAGRAAQPPLMMYSPLLTYPDRLRRNNIGGRVVVRVIVDTTGRVQSGSVHILQTPDPGFNRAVIDYAGHVEFRVAIVGGVPTRSCVAIPVDFTIRR